MGLLGYDKISTHTQKQMKKSKKRDTTRVQNLFDDKQNAYTHSRSHITYMNQIVYCHKFYDVHRPTKKALCHVTIEMLDARINPYRNGDGNSRFWSERSIMDLCQPYYTENGHCRQNDISKSKKKPNKMCLLIYLKYSPHAYVCQHFGNGIAHINA